MTEVTPLDHKRTTKKNANKKTVFICNDSDIADEYDEVKLELDMLSFRLQDKNTPADVVARFDQVKEKEAELRKLYRQHSIKFVFRSIGAKNFDQLIAEHPPTDENRKYVKDLGGNPDELRWDPYTFFPALCSVACVEPDPEFDFAEAWDSPDWNEGELGQIGQAALEANLSRRIVPSGNA